MERLLGAGAAAGAADACVPAQPEDLGGDAEYFLFNQMPVVSSRYWNIVYGAKAEDVLQDGEGLATMRTLAHNMAWLLKSLQAGREAGVEPALFTTSSTTHLPSLAQAPQPDSAGDALRLKPAAAVVSARSSGRATSDRAV